MTIEYDLQHAEWIEANVPGEKRSINDKVVMNLAAEVKRQRIQLGGMFGGVSRERIFEMGKELGREGVKREPHLSAETVDALLNALNEQVCRLNADNDRLRRESRTADAEVRRLQSQTASIVNGPWLALADKLARVETLPAKWRDAAKREHWNCVHGHCAKELETALEVIE